MIDKNIEFLKEYKKLCAKYNLALESDDPYCGLEVVYLSSDMKDMIDNLIEIRYACKKNHPPRAQD